MKKYNIIIITFILSSLAIVSTVFAGGPWKGRIIDIETKEPIEGAVVLAVWDRVYRTPAGDNAYFYEAKEVLTDKDGKFEIPEYAPINMLPIISYIKGPEFTIFKPRYLSLSGRHLSKNIIDSPTEFKRNEKIYMLSPGFIKLPRLQTRKERIRIIGGLPPLIPIKAMPELIELMNIEAVNLGLQPTNIKEKSR